MSTVTFEASAEYRAWQAKQQERHDEGRKAKLAAIDVQQKRLEEAAADRQAKLPKLVTKIQKLKAELRATEEQHNRELAGIMGAEAAANNELAKLWSDLDQTAPACISEFLHELSILQDNRGVDRTGTKTPGPIMARINEAFHEAGALRRTAATEAEAQAGIEGIRQSIDVVREQVAERQREALALQAKLGGFQTGPLIVS